MKSTMKFALSLLIGGSVFTLAACDHRETKTAEKTTALSESTSAQNSEQKMSAPVTLESGTEQEAKVADIAKDDAGEAKNDVVEAKADASETKIESEKEVEKNADAKAEMAAAESDVAPNESAKTAKEAVKTHHESAYLREQKALLKVFESQYQQIRCTQEAAKLGDNSFCRQEERRLFVEIEKVKREIRLNQ